MVIIVVLFSFIIKNSLIVPSSGFRNLACWCHGHLKAGHVSISLKSLFWTISTSSLHLWLVNLRTTTLSLSQWRKKNKHGSHSLTFSGHQLLMTVPRTTGDVYDPWPLQCSFRQNMGIFATPSELMKIWKTQHLHAFAGSFPGKTPWISRAFCMSIGG